MITVLETPCFPCKFTVSRDGRTPLDNGDFSLWKRTRAEAQAKADELNQKHACDWCKAWKDNPLGLCGSCCKFPKASLTTVIY